MNKIKTMFKLIMSKKTIAVLTLMTISGLAIAGGVDDLGLNPTFIQIADIIKGPLGKIVILLSLVWGVFQVVQTNWLQVFGAFLSAVVLVNADGIVDNFLTAGVEAINKTTPILQNLPL